MLMAEFSYLVLYLPRGTTRDAARQILTDHAEYGNWELSRLRLYPDGSRKATLRRLIIRQRRGQMGVLPMPKSGSGGLFPNISVLGAGDQVPHGRS
jgi:hypothetical protein